MHHMLCIRIYSSLPDKNILSRHVPIVQSASKQGVPDNCWHSRQATSWHCDYQNFRQIVGVYLHFSRKS